MEFSQLKDLVKPKKQFKNILSFISASFLAVSCAAPIQTPTSATEFPEDWLNDSYFFPSEGTNSGHLNMQMNVINGIIYIEYSAETTDLDYGAAKYCIIGDSLYGPSGRETFPVDDYSQNQMVEITCEFQNGVVETVIGTYPDYYAARELYDNNP